jgi:NADH:ubiquinone oxidoreductase subunit E
MGGVDTRDRYHVHWGPPEQYAERREESALRRSGRPVPDRSFDAFEAIDLAPLDGILAAEGYQPRRAVHILERTQEAYGHLPVAALQHIAHQTGAWYSELYGIATSYPHLRFEPPSGHVVRVCRCSQCLLLGGGRVLAAFREHLGTDVGGVSPDGAVRLEAADCGGTSAGHPRVEVDGQVLPRASAADAAAIAAALRATVGQGRPA